MTVTQIARVCHELNRTYCQQIDDQSQLPWDEAPEWQRTSAVNGVQFHLANPGAGPAASHESWLKEKTEQGWAFGSTKDVERKLHPCFVPYDQLPQEQKVKDTLFLSVVHALAPLLGV